MKSSNNPPSSRMIILDRDGVLNEDSDHFIKSPDEFRPIPGSFEAVARLKSSGYRVAVATNQSGVARKLFDLSTLEEIHSLMRKGVEAKGGDFDEILYCPHGPDDGCSCRKPKPGMYLEIARRFALSLEGVPVVGDSLRDLEAAVAVGARPMLVRTGKGLRTLEKREELERLGGVEVFDDLAGAVAHLLSEDAG